MSNSRSVSVLYHDSELVPSLAKLLISTQDTGCKILISKSAHRTGIAMLIEKDFVQVNLSGYGLEKGIPRDNIGYLQFARSLSSPDIYNFISKLDPVTDVKCFRRPESTWRHFEEVSLSAKTCV